MGKQGIKQERGQSLVLTALLMLIFVGILMLGIDGGMAFAKRRAAQNAADAGALAGIRVLCLDKDEALAESVAYQYATDYNEAHDAVPVASLAARSIVVTTTIPYSTTFAHFFGFNEVTAEATASAGCFSPTYGEGVLPVAWSCRPATDGVIDFSQPCETETISWNRLTQIISGTLPQDCDANTGICPELYVVMDSETYVYNENNGSQGGDFFCIEDYGASGTLHCDFDNPPDGESDWLGSGGRSWLDLDGTLSENDCDNAGEGAGELREWISNGYECELTAHTWVPENRGVSTSIFSEVDQRWRDNPLVVLPVFDDFCPTGDPRVAQECASPPSPALPKWHTGVDDINLVTASQPKYFHIQTFLAFYITCVRDHQSDPCPGADQIIDRNLGTFFSQGMAQRFKSIEGYFLEGSIPGLGGRGDPDIDTGVYTFYLTH